MHWLCLGKRHPIAALVVTHIGLTFIEIKLFIHWHGGELLTKIDTFGRPKIPIGGLKFRTEHFKIQPIWQLFLTFLFKLTISLCLFLLIGIFLLLFVYSSYRNSKESLTNSTNLILSFYLCFSFLGLLCGSCLVYCFYMCFHLV